MLAVRLFGQLRLNYDGKNLRFAVRPKVVPLLAYLLLNRSQSIARDTVAFALWPDEPEETARANLRRHLHYLREALPKSRVPWVVADARTLGWNPAARVRVDVIEFENFAEDAASLAKAVGLYGELLQGCDDEWLLASRERLRALYVRSLWELVRQARGRRNGAAAEEYLGRILADDPWREDALRTLMLVRCESGDSSSALQLCADLEGRLKREMGAPLMPETAALRRAIEQGNPLPATPLSSATSTAVASLAGLPFEGRIEELDRLQELWQRTAAGSGTLALVVGEAGIGKTRLVSEFAVRAESMGARVFWGTTSSPETTPYQAITEILRAALGFVDLSSREPYDVDVLSRILPELRQEEYPTDPRSGADAEKLFAVVADLFAEVARPRPALFVVEDLHAAGQATIAMLEHVARRCRAYRILILATLREEEPRTAETLGRLRRPHEGAKPSLIALGPLSDSATRSIAAQSLENAEEANRIAERAGGHPLFLAQMVYASEAQRNASDALPTGLRESIDARTQRLSPTASFLLRAAAVTGNAFDLEIVGESLGWSESQLATAADELIARRLIRETARSRAFEYEFAHDLIASAAYEALEDRERRRLHRRTARACERWYAARLTELASYVARHFELGGEREAAILHYLRAAKSAEASFANAEALAHARRALELGPSSATYQYELLMLVERVLARTGDRQEQSVVLDKLDRVVRKLGGGEHLRELLHRRASLQLKLGERANARRTLARLYRIASGDPRWEAIALTDEAMVLNHCGRKSEAYAAVTRATERALLAKDAEVLFSALLFHADIAAKVGRREEANESLQRAKEAAEALGSPSLTLDVLLCEAAVFTYFQLWSQVEEPARKLLDLATKIGNKNRIASAHLMLGGALGKLFDAEGARRHFRAAIELFRARVAHGMFFAYNSLAEIEAGLGRIDNAQRLLDEIAVLLPRLGVEHRAMTSVIASELARQRGEFDSAIALADSALAAIVALGNKLYEAEWLLCKGLSLREGGRAAEAVVAYERSLKIGRTSGLGAATHRAAAELALACVLAGDARAGFFAGEAFDSVRSSSRETDSPAVLWPLSQALDATGRTDQAHEMLFRAHEAFEAQRKRLRDHHDRFAFSQLRENVALESAYAALGGDSPEPDASAENPRARRGPKTRVAGPLRPPAHSP